MDKQKTFKFIEVAKCKDSVVQKFPANTNNFSQPTLTIKGVLEIMIEMSSGVLMFKLSEQFMYGVNPNDQILYDDNDSKFRLALCLDSDQKNSWIVKINENIEMIYFVLSERCKLIHRRAAKVMMTDAQVCEVQAKGQHQEVVVTATSTQQAKMAAKKEEQEQPTEQLLIEASKTLGAGLKLTGKVLSRGLQALGSFISKRIQPSEAIEISPETKDLISKSSEASNKVLQITSEQFAALFRVAKKEALKIAEKFEQSQKEKDPQKAGKYDQIKSNVKTGLHVIFNLYGGLTQGISEAGKGLAKGSADVVGAKYGKDAGEVSYDIGKGALNIYKITKIPQKEAKKALKFEEQVKK